MSNGSTFTNADRVVELLDGAATALRNCPLRRGASVRLPARGRLLATGDLHDNPLHFTALLALASLDASRDHHVVFHEIIHGDRLVNGADLSHRMLLRLAQAILDHPGQVHPLLANHELSQLTGRGVSKGAGNSVELFDEGLEYAFGDRWEEVGEALDRFIEAMPLALRSEPDARGRAVLCAHSIPSPLTMRHFDEDVLDRDLDWSDYIGPAGAAYLMTWGRGHTEAQVQSLAEHWGVTLFCLGHEHVDEGARRWAGSLIQLNSDHERGAALPIALDSVPDPAEALDLVIPIGRIIHHHGLGYS